MKPQHCAALPFPEMPVEFAREGRVGGVARLTNCPVIHAVLSRRACSSTDGFGISIASDETNLYVGSYLHDSLALNAGCVYVFSPSGGAWSQSYKLFASDSVTQDRFGTSLSLMGNTLLVGAEIANAGKGAVYIFTRSSASGAWAESGKITANDAADDDHFGSAISLNTDGVLAVGAPYASEKGAVYLYQRQGDTATFDFVSKIVAGDGVKDDAFGAALAISNEVLMIGAPIASSTGAVYHYELSNGAWSLMMRMVPAGTHNQVAQHCVAAVLLKLTSTP